MNRNFIRCDGCGVEITWAALVIHAPKGSPVFHYCCQDCLNGLLCDCAGPLEEEERRESAAGIPGAWPG